MTENYTLENYINELVELNLSVIQPLRTLGVDGADHITDYGAQILTGVTEEYLEVVIELQRSEVDPERVKLELGDMLAYITLSVIGYVWSGDAKKLGYAKEGAYQMMSDVVEQWLLEEGDEEERGVDPVKTGRALAGNAKRFFRGDFDLNFEFMVISFLELLGATNLDITDVAKANIEKLTARLASKGTFKGSGNR